MKKTSPKTVQAMCALSKIKHQKKVDNNFAFATKEPRSNETSHLHHYHFHVSKLLIIVILLCLVLVIMLRPAFENFYINREFKNLGLDPDGIYSKIEEQNSMVRLAEANVTSCNTENQRLLDSLAKMQDDSVASKSANVELQSQINIAEQECSARISKNSADWAEKLNAADIAKRTAQEQTNEVEKRYETLAKNSARSICCKNRVDNPELDSYDISSNSIVCSTSGKYKLEC